MKRFRVRYALMTLWLAASAWAPSSAQGASVAQTPAAHACASLEPSITCGPCDVGRHEHSDSDQNRLYCASDDGECRDGAAGEGEECPVVPVGKRPWLRYGMSALIALTGMWYVINRTNVTVVTRTDTTFGL